MMIAKPQKEHGWLQKLVGDWDLEAEMDMGPEKPPEKTTGKESVRSLGGLWIVAEGVGEMPGGGEGTSIMTLGYDPEKGRYLGNWVGSMMTHMWIYDGRLDEAEKVLTLDTEGPDMSGKGGTARYRDIVEIVDDDNRLLRAQVQGDDGEWQEFMVARYRRRK